MEGQIRDRCGGGAGKCRVGTGGGGSSVDDERLQSEHALFYVSKVQVIFMLHRLIFFTY